MWGSRVPLDAIIHIQEHRAQPDQGRFPTDEANERLNCEPLLQCRVSKCNAHRILSQTHDHNPKYRTEKLTCYLVHIRSLASHSQASGGRPGVATTEPTAHRQPRPLLPTSPRPKMLL